MLGTAERLAAAKKASTFGHSYRELQRVQVARMKCAGRPIGPASLAREHLFFHHCLCCNVLAKEYLGKVGSQQVIPPGQTQQPSSCGSTSSSNNG